MNHLLTLLRTPTVPYADVSFITQLITNEISPTSSSRAQLLTVLRTFLHKTMSASVEEIISRVERMPRMDLIGFTRNHGISLVGNESNEVLRELRLLYW